MHSPTSAQSARTKPRLRAARASFSLRATAWASRSLIAATLLQGAAAWAQTADAAAADAPLMLRRTPLLRDKIPEAERPRLPSFVTGDHTVGQTDYRTTVEGNAEMRRADMVIRADQLDYTQPDDLAKALGNVYINRAGDVFTGPQLELQVDAMQGFFNRASYRFLGTKAYGDSSRIDFIDDQHMVIHDVTYTTCQRRPGPSWMPDWMITARSIAVDQGSGQGIAQDAVLSFKGVSTPAIPSMPFPLTEARQSGLLPPVIGLNSTSGVETILPYYWNIAPNRDATLYPSLLSKRGIDLAGEFRYLENGYRGQIRGDYMPEDKLRDNNDRWGIAATHSGSLETGIPAIGNLGVGVNINRASDDNYWKDFPRTSPSLTQRLLPTDLNLTWGKGDFYVNARSLKWQVLQDVSSPIVPPYDRLPQLVARYSKLDSNGFDYSLEGDYTQFESNPALTNQPNARREYLLGQISRPFLAPGWFVTPKVQLHSRHYEFDYALASTNQTQASVTVPTFSLDSGLVYERDTSFLGRSLIQTLEPRAFYVRTPFRDQNNLPNYDTARSDFNFASIYTENAFVGNDRISDNNLLTLGVTSRLIDAATGAEAAKFGIAQRLRFKDQNVILPGETPTTDRLSDIMVGGSVNWTEKWAFDSTVQYNPKTDRSIRSSVGGRYNPSNYRLISAAYRLQRGTSELIDVGWQWPINDLWGDFGEDLGRGRGQGPGRFYSVGRVNYSMYDSKLVDAVAGVEYEGDCWVARVVFERLQSSTTTATKRVLFQIEFFGFSRVGSSPLEVLRRNIPRYQFLNEQVATPSRFSNYD
ncbi:LPS assembly protein LptD [Xylophilus rhododendri]|uniref:LPS-assembly protein LptD n=1 Tax=Xylophilus rhododendri TaxID=2697032 RepID=A0A857J6V6_9BURK|nr:LPS assembly protein LptD [Xylophilus rhododendri]QHI98809.1 LPS assembly protein LptD [Xylophilus rhododendri]